MYVNGNSLPRLCTYVQVIVRRKTIIIIRKNRSSCTLMRVHIHKDDVQVHRALGIG